MKHFCTLSSVQLSFKVHNFLLSYKEASLNQHINLLVFILWFLSVKSVASYLYTNCPSSLSSTNMTNNWTLSTGTLTKSFKQEHYDDDDKNCKKKHKNKNCPALLLLLPVGNSSNCKAFVSLLLSVFLIYIVTVQDCENTQMTLKSDYGKI